MAQPFGNFLKIDDRVDPLLLDAKRRNLGEGGGLDQANRCRDVPIPTPFGNRRTCARMNLRRIGGQQIDGNLKVGRITDLGNLHALGNRLLGSGSNRQNDTVDG